MDKNDLSIWMSKIKDDGKEEGSSLPQDSTLALEVELAMSFKLCNTEEDHVSLHSHHNDFSRMMQEESVCLHIYTKIFFY